jgi:hypothetical protein
VTRFFAFLVLFLSNQILLAQKWDTIRFEIRVGEEKLELGKKIWIEEAKDSIQITKFQIYVSKPFQKKKKLQPDFVFWDYSFVSNQQFLIKPNKQLFFIKVGVDSTNNLTGRFTGSLDPSNGMYWTWQNGFIHLKVEGVGNKVSNPKHFFQFHLGGYSFPNNCVGEISLGKNVGNKTLIFNVQPIILKGYEDKLFEVLSPGIKTNEFMKRFTDSIKIEK